MPFYAVANGRNIGIFSTWDECNASIKGFKQSRFKKFNTKEEAENFILYYREPSTETTHEFIPDYYVYTDGAFH